MYSWICEKCHEPNRSSINVCRNAACRFVFQGNADTSVRCGKCGKAPLGSSDYRKGRNAVLPLRRLTQGDLEAPELEAYGEAGRKYLLGLYSYLGERLCLSCHPAGLGDKLNTGLVDPERDITYETLGREIRSKLEAIKARDPSITSKEEIEIARRLMRRVDSDLFRYDKLERKVRGVIHAAIVSKISFRKNVPKSRLKESLYNFARINAARRTDDLDFIRRVLLEEAQSARKNVDLLLSDARKGPDLFSVIEEVKEAIEGKLAEISFREERLRNETPISLSIECRREVVGTYLEAIKKRYARDPATYQEVFHRTLGIYTSICEQALRHIPAVMLEAERDAIDRLEARLFDRWKPLLDAARRIIGWDIKRDLWNGPDSLSEEEAKTYGYRQFFKAPEYIDTVEFYPKGFRKPDSKEWSRKTDYPCSPWHSLHSTPIGYPVQIPARNFMRKPVNELEAVRCEVCDQRSMNVQVKNDAYAVPVRKYEGKLEPKMGRVVLGTGEIFDILDGGKLTHEDRRSYTRITLIVCSGCAGGDFLARLLSIREKQDFLQSVIEDERGEKNRREASIRRNMTDASSKLLLFYQKIGLTAMHALEAKGIVSAPIVGLSKLMGNDIRLIAVGEKVPSEIEILGYKTKVVKTTEESFGLTYLWHWLPEKELDLWKKKARAIGCKLSETDLFRNIHTVIKKKWRSDDKIWHGSVLKRNLEEVANALGMDVPELPVHYWHAVRSLKGEKADDPSFREMLDSRSAFDFCPMRTNPSLTDKDREEAKARKKELDRVIKVRRGEEACMWDPLRKRKRGGPSPKPKDKKAIPTPGVIHGSPLPGTVTKDCPAGIREKPMDPSKGVFDYDADPSKKDLSEFMMISKPYSGDNYIYQPCLVEEEKKFFVDKGECYRKDRDDAKRAKARSEALWKHRDPKTFQKVRKHK